MPPDQVASVPLDAVELYRRGVELLAAGDPPAAGLVLRRAIAIAARFALGNVALAVAEDEAGNVAAGREALGRATAERHISRRERQHIAVIALALDGNMAKASALGREHLGEFAADVLMVDVLTHRGVDLADLRPEHGVHIGHRQLGHFGLDEGVIQERDRRDLRGEDV
jgi:hypothetical protein